MKKTSPSPKAPPILIGVIIEGNQDIGKLAKLFSKKGNEIDEFAPLNKRHETVPAFNNATSGGSDRFQILPFYLEQYGYSHTQITNGVIKTAQTIRSQKHIQAEFKVVSFAEGSDALEKINYDTAEDISATPEEHVHSSLA